MLELKLHVLGLLFCAYATSVTQISYWQARILHELAFSILMIESPNLQSLVSADSLLPNAIEEFC